jgi:uncharacterized protein YkwD
MKKITITLCSLVLLTLGIQGLLAQDACATNQSFRTGETVYFWSPFDKKWDSGTYGGKNGAEHTINVPGGTMTMESLTGVYDAGGYAKLDRSLGACAECTPSHVQSFQQESLRLINAYRAKHGGAPLKLDPVLQKAAQDYVAWCSQNRPAYFSKGAHTADGTSHQERIINAAKALGVPVLNDPRNGPYVFKGVGENMTVGRLCAFDAFESWRTSTMGHDGQMKSSRHQYVGFGVACGIDADGNRFLVAAQVFGGEKGQGAATSASTPTASTEAAPTRATPTRGPSRATPPTRSQATPATASADFDPNKTYRITNQWQGVGKSLDVVNDGKNNRLQLAKTGAYSGQMWKVTSLGNGFYRLTTVWQGADKALDVVNDGKNNCLQLAKVGNYGGQMWKITDAGNGYYRLTNAWQKEEMALDVVNDGTNNQIQMAKTGAYSGQFWKIDVLK